MAKPSGAAAVAGEPIAPSPGGSCIDTCNAGTAIHISSHCPRLATAREPPPPDRGLDHVDPA
jgi:hypothetical protein